MVSADPFCGDTPQRPVPGVLRLGCGWALRLSARMIQTTSRLSRAGRSLRPGATWMWLAGFLLLAAVALLITLR